MDQKKSIADKYALDYYRDPLPTRSWKSPWNYAALIVAVLLLGATYLIARNAVFQAAPVASVHSSFGTNCATCHTDAWSGGERLIFDRNHSSVSDATCQDCHEVGAHATIALQEPACTKCHQEHRPETSLVAVADNVCASCHRDLQSAPRPPDAPEVPEPVSFFGDIRQFEEGAGGHPQFAILRDKANDVGQNHKARQLAEFTSGNWIDRGGLTKFNHQLHLDQEKLLDPDRKPATLTCASCHEADTDGTMCPIEYEQHCRCCHQLQINAPLVSAQPLPHSSVQEVRGVIRDKLARQLENAKREQVVEREKAPPPRLPVPAKFDLSQEEQLEALMKKADEAVFGFEAKGGCRHCHHMEIRGQEWRVLAPAEDPMNGLVATDIPQLNKVFTCGLSVLAGNIVVAFDGHLEMVPSCWMPHARFDHKSHRAVECVACHQTENSTKTGDVLMPSIAVCRTCHGNGARSSSTQVSADCVLCHTYHNGTQAAHFKGKPLDELFPTAPRDD